MFCEIVYKGDLIVESIFSMMPNLFLELVGVC